jgi:hypothetical protein
MKAKVVNLQPPLLLRAKVGGGLQTVYTKYQDVKKRTLIYGSPETFKGRIGKSFKFTPGREVLLTLEDPEGDVEVTAAAVVEQAETFVGRTLLVEKGKMVKQSRRKVAGPLGKKAGYNQIVGHPERMAKGKVSMAGENKCQLNNGQRADVRLLMWENAKVGEDGLFLLVDEKHEGGDKTGEQKAIVSSCVTELAARPKFMDPENPIGPVEIKEACRKYLSGSRALEVKRRAEGKDP